MISNSNVAKKLFLALIISKQNTIVHYVPKSAKIYESRFSVNINLTCTGAYYNSIKMNLTYYLEKCFMVLSVPSMNDKKCRTSSNSKLNPKICNSAQPALSKIKFYLTIKYRLDLLTAVLTLWNWLPRNGIKTNAYFHLIHIFYTHFCHPEYRWEESPGSELRITITSCFIQQSYHITASIIN